MQGNPAGKLRHLLQEFVFNLWRLTKIIWFGLFIAFQIIYDTNWLLQAFLITAEISVLLYAETVLPDQTCSTDFPFPKHLMLCLYPLRKSYVPLETERTRNTITILAAVLLSVNRLLVTAYLPKHIQEMLRGSALTLVPLLALRRCRTTASVSIQFFSLLSNKRVQIAHAVQRWLEWRTQLQLVTLCFLIYSCNSLHISKLQSEK